jgi:O-antigen ligase
MNTEAIVLLPGLLAWWVAASNSLEAALIGVYLPALLLIPDYFRMPIDGLPDPSFSECAILPIGIALCWKALFKRSWKFSPLDFALLAFVAWQFISDLHGVGFSDAQNMLFDLLLLAVFPYMAGKALIEPAGLRAPFARRFVWLLFVVSMISIYEFRMGVSLFRPLIDPFFPNQDSGWVTQIRWGFGRIAGPYGHAILMGAILAIAYLLCRWLSHSDLWERQFKGIGSALPFTKSQILTFGLLLGMFMTLSRGPWLGAACGVVLAAIGTNTDRRRGLKRAALILVGGGLILYTAGKAYIDGAGPADAVEEQASAAYRAVLLDQYNDIAMQQPVWGWGRANWPQVPGMKSIDNNYLFIALGSGLVGTALFAIMLAVASWRLFASGFFVENLDPAERAFRFTMMGIVVSTAVSLGTVFLGSQLYPLLFLLLGWGEACILVKPEPSDVRSVEPATTGFEFIKVVA